MSKTLISFLQNEMKGICKKVKLEVWDCGVNPEALGLLCYYVDKGYIKRRQLQKLIEKWVNDEIEEHRKNINAKENKKKISSP